MSGLSRVSVATGLLMLSTFAAAGWAAAQDADEQAETPSDPAFVAFWERFREAVTLDDREAVRGMTQLPIRLEGKAYDGTGFVERFDWLFTSNEKDCFASETPMRDGDAYELFCDGMIFVFRKENDRYLFAEIGVND